MTSFIKLEILLPKPIIKKPKYIKVDVLGGQLLNS